MTPDATPADTPVLVLLFNRPALVRRVIAAVRTARPSRVYLAADGPREGSDTDAAACAEARQAALESVDWPCSVRTLFREHNLGCAGAVHGALTWFFENEEQGVVLEDDCVAAPEFFRFCSDLLTRFRDDRRVFAISGDNFVESDTPRVPSYWFNGVFHCWGWATWRDRWAGVPPQIDAAGPEAIAARLGAAGLPQLEIEYWTPFFDRVRRGTAPERRIDSWAYPASYHVFVNRLLCVTPARNLVSNVGFGAGSTHFSEAERDDGRSVAAGSLSWPLRHPSRVRLNRRLHRLNADRHFGIAPSRLHALARRIVARARATLERARRLRYRARVARGYGAPLLPLVRWLLASNEITNFTYDLEPDNKGQLARMLGDVLGVSDRAVQGWFEEIENDAEFAAHIRGATTASRHAALSDPEPRIGRRLGWYAVARALKPRVIVETGVEKGLGACVLTAALRRNAAEGHGGRYYGTDIDPGAGWLLSGPYAQFGTVLRGDSLESLRRLEGPIELFVNDSDHSAAYEAREYEEIAGKLSSQAIILGDNAHVTDALKDFSRVAGREFVFFRERPSRHWYPGAGIGISYVRKPRA